MGCLATTYSASRSILYTRMQWLKWVDSIAPSRHPFLLDEMVALPQSSYIVVEWHQNRCTMCLWYNCLAPKETRYQKVISRNFMKMNTNGIKEP
jgi:hypothetical protein